MEISFGVIITLVRSAFTALHSGRNGVVIFDINILCGSLICILSHKLAHFAVLPELSHHLSHHPGPALDPYFARLSPREAAAFSPGPSRILGVLLEDMEELPESSGLVSTSAGWLGLVSSMQDLGRRLLCPAVRFGY